MSKSEIMAEVIGYVLVRTCVLVQTHDFVLAGVRVRDEKLKNLMFVSASASIHFYGRDTL